MISVQPGGCVSTGQVGCHPRTSANAQLRAFETLLLWTMNVSSVISLTLAGLIVAMVAAGFASGNIPKNLRGVEARQDTAPLPSDCLRAFTVSVPYC
jgi:hypothetical protein